MTGSGVPKSTKTYNERLFSGGIRTHFHLSRFRWVRDEIRRLGISTDSVMELGCYDGRLLKFIPQPRRYVGIDANWELGLDIARRQFSGVQEYSFVQAEHPEESGLGGECFDLVATLETLEHIAPEKVDSVLASLARHTRGHLIVTVPNEIGLVLLAKWAVKKAFNLAPDPYTLRELIYCVIGMTHRVRRKEHKGFNYRHLICQIGRHFQIVRVQGFPMSFLPTSLCFGVGIVAQPRGSRETNKR